MTADAVRRGKTARSYGTRAELAAARLYGGQKVGHMNGPADIVGVDFQTQMRTRRAAPPAAWKVALDAMRVGDKCPRMLLRFVFPGGPDDYFVFRGSDFLDWFGRDEGES